MGLKHESCTECNYIWARSRINYHIDLHLYLHFHVNPHSQKLDCHIEMKNLSPPWKKSVRPLVIYKNNPRSKFQEILKNVFSPVFVVPFKLPHDFTLVCTSSCQFVLRLLISILSGLSKSAQKWVPPSFHSLWPLVGDNGHSGLLAKQLHAEPFGPNGPDVFGYLFTGLSLT